MGSRIGNFLAFLLLFVLLSNTETQGSRVDAKENETQKTNKRSVIKTVQNKDGDIFDCVDIYQQPAFDHPLLKNHKIQMRPTTFPTGINEVSSQLDAESHVEISTVDCPPGTIPLWRGSKEDVRRFDSFTKPRKDSLRDISAEDRAILVAQGGIPTKLYGTRASLNLYQPEVNGTQLSGSVIQVSDGDGDTYSEISAGWFVIPELSGDKAVRFHIKWSNAVNNKTCYDHTCPGGFIQVNRTIGIGAKLSPVSTYKGKQYHVTFLIFKDPNTKNWWLTFGDGDTVLGYWPKATFVSLQVSASQALWGGRAEVPPGEASPPVGSGHYPYEGYGQAAYVRRATIVDDKNKLVVPNQDDCLFYVTNSICYACYDMSTNIDGPGIGFYYGGPAACRFR